jgi:DNA processing protein
MIGIVGTRKSTSYGKDFTYNLVKELKQFNITVVSGLAYGIDVFAHKASIENNIPTIGVVGHSLDRIYPAVHENVAKEMEEQGGVLSEFISGTKPDAENFPKRNRIVAGICDAVIVVEAGIKGGALITAEIANSYNRDVYAVPGRVGDVYSEGCNYLIKANKAALLDSAYDFAFMMGWTDDKKQKAVAQKSLFIDLNPEEQKIVDLLNAKGNLGIDELCILSQVPITKAASLLLNMEFAGVIKSLPGKIYSLT